MKNEFKYSKVKNGYKLEKDYIYRTKIYPLFSKEWGNARLDLDGTLTMRKGFVWDGATGAIDRPKRILRLGVREKILRASCVHDALCYLIAADKLNLVYRRMADEIFKDICEEDGMSWIRVQWTYLAIRIYVKLKYGWEY